MYSKFKSFDNSTIISFSGEMGGKPECRLLIFSDVFDGFSKLEPLIEYLTYHRIYCFASLPRGGETNFDGIKQSKQQNYLDCFSQTVKDAAILCKNNYDRDIFEHSQIKTIVYGEGVGNYLAQQFASRYRRFISGVILTYPIKKMSFITTTNISILLKISKSKGIASFLKNTSKPLVSSNFKKPKELYQSYLNGIIEAESVKTALKTEYDLPFAIISKPSDEAHFNLVKRYIQAGLKTVDQIIINSPKSEHMDTLMYEQPNNQSEDEDVSNESNQALNDRTKSFALASDKLMHEAVLSFIEKVIR